MLRPESKTTRRSEAVTDAVRRDASCSLTTTCIQLHFASYGTLMPRKPNLRPVQPHYSPDLRRRVIHQAFTLGESTTRIAINLDMPLRVVQRVIATWKEIGDVCRNRKRIGRSPVLKTDAVKVCMHLTMHCTQAFIDYVYRCSSCWRSSSGAQTSISTRYRKSSKFSMGLASHFQGYGSLSSALGCRRRGYACQMCHRPDHLASPIQAVQNCSGTK